MWTISIILTSILLSCVIYIYIYIYASCIYSCLPVYVSFDDLGIISRSWLSRKLKVACSVLKKREKKVLDFQQSY